MRRTCRRASASLRTGKAARRARRARACPRLADRAKGSRAAGGQAAARASRGSAGSRGASKVGESALECLADLGEWLRRVDDPYALRLGFGEVDIRLAHAL